MAVLSVGDAGQDVFAYDEAVSGPFSLVGEGLAGDVFAIQAGNQVRPQSPGGGGGIGDVSRNGATIDNRLTRWHGSAAEIQNTVVTLNDSGDFSGINNLSMIGILIVNSDSDGTTILGATKVGSISADEMNIAHYDHFTLTNKALQQKANGAVKLNTIAGQTLKLAVENTSVVDITSILVAVKQALTVDGIITAGSGSTVITTVAGLLRHQAIDPAIAGSGLSVSGGVLSVDAHAPAAHTIAFHSDTVTTGAQLTSLANGSMVDTFHRHSKLSASDGSPDGNFSLDAAGNATLATGNVSIPAGSLGIGVTPPTAGIHSLVSANSLRSIIIENPNSGTAAIAELRAEANGGFAQIMMHGTGRTATRYGKTLGNMAEVLANSASGLLIGSIQAIPIIFGTNNLERFRIDGTGDVEVVTGSLAIPEGGLEVQGGPSKHIKGFGRMPAQVSIAIDSGDDLTITDEDDFVLVTTGTSSTLQTIIGGFDGQKITLAVPPFDTFTLKHNGVGPGLPVFNETFLDVTCDPFRHYNLRRAAGGAWICTDS